MVEPRLCRRAVEHAIRFAVRAVRLQLQLQVGGDVGAGVPPPQVERREDLRHVEDELLEQRRVGEAAFHRAVAADEELVGGELLQLDSRRSGLVTRYRISRSRNVAASLGLNPKSAIWSIEVRNSARLRGASREKTSDGLPSTVVAWVITRRTLSMTVREVGCQVAWCPSARA